MKSETKGNLPNQQRLCCSAVKTEDPEHPQEYRSKDEFMSEAMLRARIRSTAVAQIGAHYVWGGYGNMPGDRPDPNPYPGAFGSRVRMWTNDPTANQEDHGRSQPILNAAYTNIVNRVHICGGRFNRVTGQQADPATDNPDGPLREVLLWPRPNDSIDARETVWGESCVGIRHFDCIGFVNWVFWQVLSRPVQFSIEQWRQDGRTTQVAINTSALTEGDLLFAAHAGGSGNNGNHIGIYIGAGKVVHSRSYTIGVEETPLMGGGTRWDRAGAPRILRM